MKSATLSLFAAAVAPVALGVTPAHADPLPRECVAADMTVGEFTQVDFGMRRFKVNQLVGGVGMRLTAESSETYLVRRWTYCNDDVWIGGDQWLVFERDTDGHWVVSEIR